MSSVLLLMFFLIQKMEEKGEVCVRMERFVPYFLEKFKGKPTYPGKNHMFILFPDHGAYSRYATSVRERLKLDWDHILTLISLL